MDKVTHNVKACHSSQTIWILYIRMYNANEEVNVFVDYMCHTFQWLVVPSHSAPPDVTVRYPENSHGKMLPCPNENDYRSTNGFCCNRCHKGRLPVTVCTFVFDFIVCCRLLHSLWLLVARIQATLVYGHFIAKAGLCCLSPNSLTGLVL